MWPYFDAELENTIGQNVNPCPQEVPTQRGGPHTQEVPSHTGSAITNRKCHQKQEVPTTEVCRAE